MSLSVEDIGDSIIVTNPLSLPFRLFEIVIRIFFMCILVDAAWKKLTLDPETYYSIFPYLNEPPWSYLFATLTVAIIVAAVVQTLSEGPETWALSDDGITYARKTLAGTRRRQWSRDRLTKIVYRTRKLDGPDLFRLELYLKGGARLELTWMKSRSDRDALGDRLQEMFPSAFVELDNH